MRAGSMAGCAPPERQARAAAASFLLVSGASAVILMSWSSVFSRSSVLSIQPQSVSVVPTCAVHDLIKARFERRTESAMKAARCALLHVVDRAATGRDYADHAERNADPDPGIQTHFSPLGGGGSASAEPPPKSGELFLASELGSWVHQAWCRLLQSCAAASRCR